MIITPEQAALKARQQFGALRNFVRQATRDGQRIDTVERELFRQLLGLGHTLLSAFVVQQGDGDVGPLAETPEGSIARRLPERHDRRRAGYPIGSGVAEGACRHLVKERLEPTGMRWTVEGAQAMLQVGAMYLNDQWEEFLAFRVEQEQAQLYKRVAA